MRKTKLRIKNSLSELDKVHTEVADLMKQWELPQKTAFNIDLCLEELLTNTVSYGYSDNNEHFIDITFSEKGKGYTVLLIDDAEEFNPLDKEDPDTDLPLDERTPGGLGIFFVKQLTESFTYSRENGKNIINLEFLREE